MSTLYDTDFYAWTQEQAAAIREGRWDALDRVNLEDEIASLGRQERTLVRHLLEQLCHQYLAWWGHPEQRAGGWESTITTYKHMLEDVLEDSPSVAVEAPALLQKVWQWAIRLVQDDYPQVTFPPSCPWTVEDLCNADHLPGNDPFRA